MSEQANDWLTDLLPEGMVLEGAPESGLTVVSPAKALLPLRYRRRDHTGLQRKVFTDRTGVHWPGNAASFEVVYSLLSMQWNTRVRVKVPLAEGETLTSVTKVWPAAGWFEREVFDRFGMEILGHADRRPMLTDYGFEGHPLRKDFPLTGFTEVRYDEAAKRVVCEPVELSQERRGFDLSSPRRGASGEGQTLTRVKVHGN